MNFKYRNQHNAEAVAKYWSKSLDKPDWYKIENLSDNEVEIMIYDVIGWPFNDAAELIHTFAEMKQNTITVRINSPGGDVFDSIAIYNALQSHKSKIITRIESLAASAASFIALAGKETQAYKNALMMIHDPWVMAVGNQYDLREIADVLDKISGNMVDIYSSATKIGKREITDMMKAETWLNAKEMKDKGFIDTILDGKAVKAEFDLSVFANCPECLSGNKDHEPTIKDLEKALRDAGLSKNSAKATLARGWKAGNAEEEIILAAQKTLNIFGGK